LHDPKLEDVDSGALVQHTIERALVGVDAVIQTLGVSPTPEPILGGTRLLSVASNMQGSVALVHVVQNPIKEVLLESLSRCTTNCALLCQQRRSI
jgi:hypothetical protein